MEHCFLLSPSILYTPHMHHSFRQIASHTFSASLPGPCIHCFKLEGTVRPGTAISTWIAPSSELDRDLAVENNLSWSLPHYRNSFYILAHLQLCFVKEKEITLPNQEPKPELLSSFLTIAVSIKPPLPYVSSASSLNPTVKEPGPLQQEPLGWNQIGARNIEPPGEVHPILARIWDLVCVACDLRPVLSTASNILMGQRFHMA